MGFRSVESKIIPFRLIKKSNLYSLSFGEGWGEYEQKKLFYISNWYYKRYNVKIRLNKTGVAITIFIIKK